MQTIVLLLHLWDLSIPVTLSKLWLLLEFWLFFTAASLFNRTFRNCEHTYLHSFVHFYGTSTQVFVDNASLTAQTNVLSPCLLIIDPFAARSGADLGVDALCFPSELWWAC